MMYFVYMCLHTRRIAAKYLDISLTKHFYLKKLLKLKVTEKKNKEKCSTFLHEISL